MIDDELSYILNFSISEWMTPSFSDQNIASKTCIDIELRKLWLNWRIFMKGGRTRKLCSCFNIRRWRLRPDTNKCHVLSYVFIINNRNINIRYNDFNITQFVLTRKWNPLILFNRNWHFLLAFFWRIRPHVYSIDKDTQSSSLNNSQKVPLPLSDKFYQYDGSSKLSIAVISDTKVLRVLVNMYLSFTTGSELLLLNTLVRMKNRWAFRHIYIFRW